MFYDDNIVLCGASAYEKKFYINENFDTLPEVVKDELKAMCVLFTEDVGGVLTLVFDEDGNLTLNVTAEEDDILFDQLVVKKLNYSRRREVICEWTGREYVSVDFMDPFFDVSFYLYEMPLLYKLLLQVEHNDLMAIKQLNGYLNGGYLSEKIKKVLFFKR